MDQGHHSWYPSTLLLKVKIALIDKILLEHVGLPHVLDLAVQLVNFLAELLSRILRFPLQELLVKRQYVLVAVFLGLKDVYFSQASVSLDHQVCFWVPLLLRVMPHTSYVYSSYVYFHILCHSTYWLNEQIRNHKRYRGGNNIFGKSNPKLV